MYKLLLVFAFLCPLFSFSNPNHPVVDVTDQTIKIKATQEEEIMFGFAAGDKIIFNFEEVNNKDLKEIEILEYPNTSKFSDYKTSKVLNKEFTISRQAIYIFRFKNSAISGRICKIKIQRIPASEGTINFNSAVVWMTKQDTIWNSVTTYALVGYDTAYQQKIKKELVSSEQREELLFSKSQRVHSTTNENGNRTSIFFSLPKNIVETNKSTRVVAWAYWVGVGEESNKAWQSNVKVFQNLIKTGATYFTSPLGAFAVGEMTELMTPKLGEDVSYWVTDQINRNNFHNNLPFRYYDDGKGVAGYRKFSDPVICQGNFFLCMSNDNMMQGINAEVKVVAIVEIKQFQDISYTEQVITPRYEKQLKREPIVKTSQIPVTGI